MLTPEIKESISESVLCWLATANEVGEPNCSPKEVFAVNDKSELVIANIASPESVKNILINPNVCVSFIHIFKQKGFKIKGPARYVSCNESEFEDLFPLVKSMVGDTFKVQGFIVLTAAEVAPIIAPSYYFVKGTTEAGQIANAKKIYGV